HLLNYPVINNGIHAFKSNEYGRRSIKLGNAAHQTFAAPIIPYFSKPYQYVSPYVPKVDSLGVNALDRIDKRFIVVKKPTEELYRDTRAPILLPYRKDHVFQVYSSKAKKNEQAGLVAHGKAAVTTVLVVSNETLSLISSFLHQKKAKTTNTVNEKINQ
ncbi:CAP20-virulence factor, partial [Fusarium acutatum]